MDFLALSPGVHSIQSLLLTDVQSGFVMTLRYVYTNCFLSKTGDLNVLRSVMDIVVHEPELPYRTTSTETLG